MSEDKESKPKSPAPVPDKEKESGGKGQRYYLYEHELNRPTDIAPNHTATRGFRPRLPFSMHDYQGIYPTADEETFLQRQYQRKLRESLIYSRPPDVHHSNNDRFRRDKKDRYDGERRRTYYDQHDDRRHYDERSSHIPPPSYYYDDKRRIEPHYYKSHSYDSHCSSYRRDSYSMLNGRMLDRHSRHYEPSSSRQRHSYESYTRSRSRTPLSEAESQPESKEQERDEYDLNAQLHPLMHFIEDRPKLLKEAMSILKGKKLAAMTPPVFAGVSQRQLEDLCLTELESLNIATIANVIDGKLVNSELANPKVEKKAKVISVKKIKKKLKQSLTQGNSVKKKKQKQEVTGEFLKIKKIKKSKKHKKKKKKTKTATDDDEPAGDGLPPQKTLMELLELEYRAKAIKALLKSQDINSSKIDDALLEEPDLPHTLVPPSDSIPHSSTTVASSISNPLTSKFKSVVEEAVSVTTTTDSEGKMSSLIVVDDAVVSTTDDAGVHMLHIITGTSPSTDPVSSGVNDDQLLKADDYADASIVVKDEMDVDEDSRDIFQNLENQMYFGIAKEIVSPVEIDRVSLTHIGKEDLSCIQMTQTEETIIDGVGIENIGLNAVAVVVEEEKIINEEGTLLCQAEDLLTPQQLVIKIEIVQPNSNFEESEEHIVKFKESEAYVVEFEKSKDNIFEPEESELEDGECEDDEDINSDLEVQTLDNDATEIFNTYVRRSTDIPVISPPVVAEKLPSPKIFLAEQPTMSRISASDVSSDESIDFQLLQDDGIDIGEMLADTEPQPSPLVFTCEPKPEDYEDVSQNSDFGDDQEEEFEDDEEANPRTWFNRWYNSKKVQKNVKSNRVIGKLRSKLRREKQIPEPPPPEPDEATVPIIGSIDEYQNLFSSGKFKADPREEDSMPSEQVIVSLEGETLAEELPGEEDDVDELWGDIIG